MNSKPVWHRRLSRLMLFFALSRTPHGVIDLATPFVAALLALGAFPSFGVCLLGIITAFAGYTAVYALNDVVDMGMDKKKIQAGPTPTADTYLDAAMVRHPLARGLLQPWEGIVWVLAWTAVALVGAWMLNPVCVFIFLAGCLLEVVYCLLIRVTHFRTLVSGVVKTAGGLAAVFAVQPHPSLLFLVFFFAWIFLWEVGGQNIPADWTDIEQDRQLKARTVPVRLGIERAGRMAMGSLSGAAVMVLPVMWSSPASFGLLVELLALVSGLVLLAWPGFNLMSDLDRTDAMRLFNRASLYPLAILLWVGISLAVG